MKSKKILSMVCALAIMLTVSVTAFAGPATQNLTDSKKTSDAINVKAKIDNMLAVTIGYEADLTFVPVQNTTDKTWSWAPAAEGDNVITATNNSPYAVTATYTYTPASEQDGTHIPVTGTFTSATKALPADSSSVENTFNLTGTDFTKHESTAMIAGTYTVAVAKTA